MPFTIYAKAIIPKQALNVPKVQKEVGGVLDKVGKYGQKQFEKTTSSWTEGAPIFTHLAWRQAGSLYLWIGPGGSAELVMKWRRIDEGSKGKRFGPRNAPYLRFPFQGRGNSYKAATRKRHFGSSQRKKYGPVTNFSQVDHPGIREPREWSIALGEKLIGPLARDVQDAVTRGLA